MVVCVSRIDSIVLRIDSIAIKIDSICATFDSKFSARLTVNKTRHDAKTTDSIV